MYTDILFVQKGDIHKVHAALNNKMPSDLKPNVTPHIYDALLDR